MPISDLSKGATRTHLNAIEARYGQAEQELLAILIEMERRLLSAFVTGPILEPGGLNRRNVVEIQLQIRRYTSIIDILLFAPGSPGAAWIDTYATLSTAAGVERMQKGLALAEDLGLANTTGLRQTLQNFAIDESAGVLTLGRDRLIQTLDRHSTDTLAFLQEQYTRAAVEGIPVVGPGDTLANRLFKGGRLNDLTIQTSAGPRTIKAETRAQSFARTELNRIETDATIQVGQALGIEKYLDAGPNDERTSDICLEALAFGGDEPRTLEEWETEGPGITPRHPNCRHRMVPVPNEAL